MIYGGAGKGARTASKLEGDSGLPGLIGDLLQQCVLYAMMYCHGVMGQPLMIGDGQVL